MQKPFRGPGDLGGMSSSPDIAVKSLPRAQQRIDETAIVVYLEYVQRDKDFGIPSFFLFP
jgi:hypothetical protein